MPVGTDDIDEFRLPSDQLAELGIQVARLRQQIKGRVQNIKAIGFASDDIGLPGIPGDDIQESNSKLERHRLLSRECCENEAKEAVVSHKYKRRRYCDLSAHEIVEIAHSSVVEERLRRDIAAEYRVSVGLVSRVASKFKAGALRVDEIRAGEEAVE